MNNTHKTDQYRFEVQGKEWIIEFEYNIKSCAKKALKIGIKNIIVGWVNYLYQEGEVSKYKWGHGKKYNAMKIF